MDAKTLQAGLEDELLPVEAQVPRPAQACPGACVTDALAWSPSPSACCAFPFLWDGDGDGEAEEHNSCVEVAQSLPNLSSTFLTSKFCLCSLHQMPRDKFARNIADEKGNVVFCV